MKNHHFPMVFLWFLWCHHRLLPFFQAKLELVALDAAAGAALARKPVAQGANEDRAGGVVVEWDMNC